jgi:2-keto-4-pentenoate hydratase
MTGTTAAARGRLQRAVGLIAAAWESGAPLAELPPDLRPRTPAEGYRMQEMLGAALGFPVSGWKVGATTPAARRMFRTRAPFAARLYGPRVLDAGARLPGSALRLRGVECEVTLRLGRDLPARRSPYGLDEVRDAVDAVVPSIEVVEPRWADWIAAGIPSVVADGGGNGWMVLGQALAGARRPKGDLSDLPVELEIDGEVAVRGTGANAHGGPYLSLLWLANRMRTGPGLQAGMIVATGSCTGLHKAAPGNAVVARFGALGSVSLTFGG